MEHPKVSNDHYTYNAKSLIFVHKIGGTCWYAGIHQDMLIQYARIHQNMLVCYVWWNMLGYTGVHLYSTLEYVRIVGVLAMLEYIRIYWSTLSTLDGWVHWYSMMKQIRIHWCVRYAGICQVYVDTLGILEYVRIH